MSESSNTHQLTQDAALRATAEQLDIAGEDVSEALGAVLEAFESTAAQLEALEARITNDATSPSHTGELLHDIKAIRHRLSAAMVSLQFEDRLAQRLGLAARELRGWVIENTDTPHQPHQPDPTLASSVHSLYAQNQIRRILTAAGCNTKEADTDAEGRDESDLGGSVELF